MGVLLISVLESLIPFHARARSRRTKKSIIFLFQEIKDKLELVRGNYVGKFEGFSFFFFCSASRSKLNSLSFFLFVISRGEVISRGGNIACIFR